MADLPVNDEIIIDLSDRATANSFWNWADDMHLKLCVLHGVECPACERINKQRQDEYLRKRAARGDL